MSFVFAQTQFGDANIHYEKTGMPQTMGSIVYCIILYCISHYQVCFERRVVLKMDKGGTCVCDLKLCEEPLLLAINVHNFDDTNEMVILTIGMKVVGLGSVFLFQMNPT